VVVGFSLAAVAAAVLISRWSNANAERRGVRHRVVCRICRHVFEERGRERRVECPECGALNERGRGPLG
jgi:rRNA maturation endonuclease Nob1